MMTFDSFFFYNNLYMIQSYLQYNNPVNFCKCLTIIKYYIEQVVFNELMSNVESNLFESFLMFNLFDYKFQI